MTLNFHFRCRSPRPWFHLIIQRIHKTQLQRHRLRHLHHCLLRLQHRCLNPPPTHPSTPTSTKKTTIITKNSGVKIVKRGTEKWLIPQGALPTFYLYLIHCVYPSTYSLIYLLTYLPIQKPNHCWTSLHLFDLMIPLWNNEIIWRGEGGARRCFYTVKE